MLDNNVYMIATNYYKYDNSKIFNPSKRYLEGVNLDIKSDEKVYDLVRNLFIEMNLDSEHIGTKDWNPFGDFISPDNKVVIKPNLVKDINELSNSNTDCLITNFSIIRPIIDYTIIALKNTGSIIVGDAPVQECNFSSVVKLNGLSEAVNIYNDNGFKIELKDFRKNEVADLKCKIVSLVQNSSLSDVDKYCKKYAITNYNLKYMNSIN